MRQVVEGLPTLQVLMTCFLMSQLKAHWFLILQQPSLQLQIIWQFAGNLHPVSPLPLTFLWLIQVSLVFQRRRNGCQVVQPWSLWLQRRRQWAENLH